MTAEAETLIAVPDTGVIEPDRVETYDAGAIEAKWRARWQQDQLYRVEDTAPGEKWYSLTMYPYPSGTLHIGHWFAFVAPDVFARLQRMRGYNVLFPMGFDAFGLPAENAAIRHGIHPATWTFENIAAMRRQYDQMGAMINWSREVITCTPEYYRWNQWFFLQMLKRGLAYRAKGAVWWCPKDQTVLANEQVLEGNICERCGTEVYKRDLEQWYFRITDYAEELLRDTEGRTGRNGSRSCSATGSDGRRARGCASAWRPEIRWRCSRPGRYGLGRDLYGPGAGASAGPADHDPGSFCGRRGLHRPGTPPNRDRAHVDR